MKSSEINEIFVLTFTLFVKSVNFILLYPWVRKKTLYCSKGSAQAYPMKYHLHWILIEPKKRF